MLTSQITNFGIKKAIPLFILMLSLGLLTIYESSPTNRQPSNSPKYVSAPTAGLTAREVMAAERSADAAESSLVLSIFSLFVACAGTWAVVLNLRHAKESADAATNAAKAAENSVKIAREIGVAQVRAYLSLVSADVYFLPKEENHTHGHRAVLRLNVVNSGQSPAFVVSWGASGTALVRQRLSDGSGMQDVEENVRCSSIKPRYEAPANREVIFEFGIENEALLSTAEMSLPFQLPGTVSEVNFSMHIGLKDVFGGQWDMDATGILTFAGGAIFTGKNLQLRNFTPDVQYKIPQ